MLTKNAIKESLKNVEAPKGVPVIVHSAMRIVGETEGGVKGFLDALIEYFTDGGGLLVIPTHTWDKLGREKITLDLTKRETNLGALSKAALLDGRGIRSENPTHSAVVFGEKDRALDFISGERLAKTPTGVGGCYARLYDEGGAVLLVGVSHTANTYLHSVDEILGRYDRMESAPMSLAVRLESAEVREREFYTFDESCGDLSYRFDKLSVAFRYHGAEKPFFIGEAPPLLCDARGMKEAVEIIYSRCGDYDILADEKPIDPRLYVREKRT